MPSNCATSCGTKSGSAWTVIPYSWRPLIDLGAQFAQEGIPLFAFKIAIVPVRYYNTFSLSHADIKGFLDRSWMPFRLNSHCLCLLPSVFMWTGFCVLRCARICPSPMEDVFTMFRNSCADFLLGLSNIWLPAFACDLVYSWMAVLRQARFMVTQDSI